MVPSRDILRRVLAAEGLHTHSRLALLEQLPGNPIGVEQQRVGDGFAFSARHIPVDGFNRVVGLTDAEAGAVPWLIAWFEDKGIRGRFEITPGIDAPEVTRALVREGYGASRPIAVLFGEAAPRRRARGRDCGDGERLDT